MLIALSLLAILQQTGDAEDEDGIDAYESN